MWSGMIHVAALPGHQVSCDSRALNYAGLAWVDDLSGYGRVTLDHYQRSWPTCTNNCSLCRSTLQQIGKLSARSESGMSRWAECGGPQIKMSRSDAHQERYNWTRVWTRSRGLLARSILVLKRQSRWHRRNMQTWRDPVGVDATHLPNALISYRKRRPGPFFLNWHPLHSASRPWLNGGLYLHFDKSVYASSSIKELLVYNGQFITL
jgi:hypothetical protein